MPSCLIVVDMQRDFIDGTLGFPASVKVVEVVKQKIQTALDRNEAVYFTLDTHEPDYLSGEEGNHLPVLHCQKGTPGHELHPDLTPFLPLAAGVFEKPSFPSLALANHLQTKSYDRVELCGLVSNICVLANAVMVKSALPNAHLVIDKTATASFDEALHEAALAVLKSIHVEIWEETHFA